MMKLQEGNVTPVLMGMMPKQSTCGLGFLGANNLLRFIAVLKHVLFSCNDYQMYQVLQMVAGHGPADGCRQTRFFKSSSSSKENTCHISDTLLTLRSL